MYELSKDSVVTYKVSGVQAVTYDVQAKGTLTFIGPVINGETVTVDSDIFEFSSDGTVTPGNNEVVMPTRQTVVDDSIPTAVQALADKINAISATVTAKAVGNTVVVTAVTGGTGGNSIASTDTCTNASWGAATLAGGAAAASSATIPLFKIDNVGTKFIATDVLFYGEDVGTLTTEPTISLGVTGTAYTDLIADTDLAGLDTNGLIKIVNPTLAIASNTQVYAKVNTPAVSDTYLLTIAVTGYFI